MFNLNNLLPSKMKASQDSRKRFRISAFQVQSLEDVFKNNPRPCKEIQEEVATQLNLPYRTVTIWFQNRRAKAKLIGEPIADHVFQWKPPVVANKTNHSSKSNDSPVVKQEQDQESFLESTQFPDQETSPEQDSQQSSAGTNQFSNPRGPQTNFNPNMSNQSNGWVPGSSYNNNNNWASVNSSMPRQSADSASFVSDFTNYEGCNFQMNFDNFLTSQNNMNTQLGVSSSCMLTTPEGFNPQQILAYPAGIFTPSLSHSVISLSTQGTGSSGFYNDCSNSSIHTMPNNFYAHPHDMSVQSLPQFNGQGSQSLSMANSLVLQHPTLSAPELAFRTNLPNIIQPAPSSRNPIQAKMEQERNNAMFFSMRS